jgi:hypothetical protein
MSALHAQTRGPELIIDRARCLDGGQRLIGIFEMVPVRPTRCATGQDALRSAARITASPSVPHTGAVRRAVFDVATGNLSEVT